MSGCFDSDKLENCKHGVHVRLTCFICSAEHKINHLESQIALHTDRMNELEKKHEFLLEVYKCNFASKKYRESKKPHVCPVCNGLSKQPLQFIQDENEIGFINRCISCEGKGIVWG